MKNMLIIISLLLISSTVFAKKMSTKHLAYYGEWAQVFHLVKPHKLKSVLHTILSHDHVYVPGEADQILHSTSCPGQIKNCYRHKLAEFDGAPQPSGKASSQVRSTYRNARHVLYQAITPVKVAEGVFEFNPIYFSKPIIVKGNDNFQFFQFVNNNGINAEHVWPQSKFGGHKNDYSNRYKKCDLHHIYPANSKMNSHRGSFPFAEIRNDSSDPNFGNVVGAPIKIPMRASSSKAFMPIPSSRGRVARAIMYFATRYNKSISADQEYFIRKWHREYPVTKEEIRRNNRIFKYQLVRNPFVDYPQLESHIADL